MAGRRRCWKCSKFSEIKDMMYDISGKDLICPACLAAENRVNKKGGGEKATATAADIAKARQSSNIKVKAVDDEESTTMSYQCGSCGLGFSEEKGVMIRTCPYCGKGNFRVAVRDSAQRLIEESAKDNFEN